MVESIGGERAFRRRLLEMGLAPGTEVALVNVAPLGDPLEIEVRSGRLSIRRAEAAQIVLGVDDRARAHSSRSPATRTSGRPRCSTR